MTVELQEAGLWLQGLDFMMEEPDPDEGYRFQASSDGHSWGQLEPVINSIASQLSDGDIEDVERFENRDITIMLMIDAPDSELPGVAVAAGQRVLELACQWPGWGTLQWRSPLAGAKTSVMEVLWAVPQRVSEGFDLDEMLQGKRFFSLSLRVRPFVRSEDEVEVEAPAVSPEAPPEDAVIDAGTSTVDWLNQSTATEATLSASMGAPFAGMVYARSYRDGSKFANPATPSVYLNRYPDIALDASRPYIVVTGYARWRGYAAGATPPAWRTDALTVRARGSYGSADAELVDFSIVDGSFVAVLRQTQTISTMLFSAVAVGSLFMSYEVEIGIDSIVASAVAGGVFTGKVQTRTVALLGSQRTEVPLTVLGLADSTPTGLGEQVLVCSIAGGASDDGRAKFASARTLSSKTGTTDSSATSGVYNAVGTTASPTTFDLPAASLLAGDFALYPRLQVLTAGEHLMSYRVSIASPDGTQVITSPWTERRIIAAASSSAVWPVIPEDAWRMVPLGIADMLVEAIPGGTITLSLAGPAGVFRVDDVFLAHAVGQVTLVDTGKAGGSLSKVTVDAATLDRPYPTVWVGEVDGSMMDAVRAGRVQAGGEEHQAVPPLLTVATVTPGCATSRLSARYYPRNAWDVA